MKKKKNRLTNIIKWELVCLVAVTILVAGLVKWSENRSGADNDQNTRQTVSGMVKAQDEPGDDGLGQSKEVGQEPSTNLGESPTGAVKNPGNTAQDPLDGTGETGQEGGEPLKPSGSDNGIKENGNGQQDVKPTGDAGMPVPTKEAGTPTNTPKPTAEPTQTGKPKNTPTPAPQNTPTPLPTPTLAPTPTPTLAPTPTPQISNTEGMDTDFIASLTTPQSGELLTAAGAVDTVYYLQTDPRWGSLIYGGEDTIAKYACGPTSMAIVVSSLTDIGIDPVQMSGWAFNKGYWYPKSGSLHSVVNGTAKAFGLKSEGVGNDSDTPKKVKEALKNGDMVVVLMGKGHFTKGGHFIVLRGITAEGKILVADCNSRENTMTEWDFETIQSEAKWASDGGPFWIIRNPN